MSAAFEPERFVIHKIPVNPELLKQYPHLSPVVWRIWDKAKERYVPFSNTASNARAQRMLAKIRERADG